MKKMKTYFNVINLTYDHFKRRSHSFRLDLKKSVAPTTPTIVITKPIDEEIATDEKPGRQLHLNLKSYTVLVVHNNIFYHVNGLAFLAYKKVVFAKIRIHRIQSTNRLPKPVRLERRGFNNIS